MKRIIATAALAIMMAATALAQNPITGTWTMKKTVMGTTVADFLSFENDTQGTATNKIAIDLKVSILGVKASGQAEITVTGAFTASEDKLTINWDKESFVMNATPIEMSYMGEAIEDDTADFQEMMDDIIKDIKEDLEKNPVDEYFNVRVKGDKLSLTSLDEKGKKETTRFTKVQ